MARVWEWSPIAVRGRAKQAEERFLMRIELNEVERGLFINGRSGFLADVLTRQLGQPLSAVLFDHADDAHELSDKGVFECRWVHRSRSCEWVCIGRRRKTQRSPGQAKGGRKKSSRSRR